MAKPRRMNLAQSLLALSEFTDSYNERFDPAEGGLSQMVRANTLAVAERLLKILSRESSAGKSCGEHGTKFRTNTAAIATLTKNSTRTVQRQLNRLEMAGIIIARHPKNSPTTESQYYFNYYLELNPEFVQFQDEKIITPVDNSLKPVDNSVDNMLTVDNSPFLDSLDPEKRKALEEVLINDLQKNPKPLSVNLSHIGSREPLEQSRTITRTYSGFFNFQKPEIGLLKIEGELGFWKKLEPFWNSGTSLLGRLAEKQPGQKQMECAENFEKESSGAEPGAAGQNWGELRPVKTLSSWIKEGLVGMIPSRDASIVALLQSYLQRLKYEINPNNHLIFSKI